MCNMFPFVLNLDTYENTIFLKSSPEDMLSMIVEKEEESERDRVGGKREREKEGERERKNINGLPPVWVPTGARTIT